MREARLAIDSLDEDGRGVGRTPDGRTLHVSGALPGEHVHAAIEHESPHAARAWGHLLAVEGAPSPERVAPACPAFGRCGGCALQHLSYPGQRREKRARVQAALAAAGVLGAAEVAEVVASDATLGWRNRAKYVIGAAASGAPGALVLGSFAPASHALVDMEGCRVPEGPVAALAPAFRAALEATGLPAYDEGSRAGELRYLVLRANHEGQVLALVVVRSGAGEAALAHVAAELVATHAELAGVVLQENTSEGGGILGGRERVLAGAGTLADVVGGVRLELSASAFFQVNRAQAARLYARVADELAAAPGARLVDLYSGAGGIALTLGARGARVIGVESIDAAVADARRSAAAAGLAERVTFERGDAADGLPHAAAALGGLDGLCVNPPRKGLSASARRAVVAARPRRLVYVSCGPDSLARDLAELRAAGFAVRALQPFDLMPGTPQIETVATLELE
jgi:23S rRNA (uracil1939-C5)-methyltransferase